MKKALVVIAIALFGFVGCRNEMPAAPQSSTSLEGNWNYVSTDGQDFSDYGITYSFTGDTWTYTLGDAGQKQYRYDVSGDSIKATLIADGLHSSDAIGSMVRSAYTLRGDTLTMQTDGHIAVLARQ
jgi:hypothetical protein